MLLAGALVVEEPNDGRLKMSAPSRCCRAHSALSHLDDYGRPARATPLVLVCLPGSHVQPLSLTRRDRSARVVAAPHRQPRLDPRVLRRALEHSRTEFGADFHSPFSLSQTSVDTQNRPLMDT